MAVVLEADKVTGMVTEELFSAPLEAVLLKATKLVSSLVISPKAVLVPKVANVGLLRVTVNPSAGSTTVSPETAILITCVVSAAAKDTVPVGNAPPKSAATEGFVPLAVTA